MAGFYLEPEESPLFLPNDGGRPPVDLDLRALTTEQHFLPWRSGSLRPFGPLFPKVGGILETGAN